jgi:hypothetical protein
MVNEQNEIESEETDLVDFRLIALYTGFAFASVRRHARLVFWVFGGIIATTVTALLVMPKTYHIETKILARRNHALAVRGDSGNDAPTSGASESVMRRDNLAALIKQTDLLHQWYNRRAPILRAKDFIVGLIRPPESEQDTIEWMSDLLEKKLSVWTLDGVVGIGIDWPDATVGLHLVEAAQQNYLESRHVEEVTALAEEVSILRGHADSLRSDIDGSVDAIGKLRDVRAEPSPDASAAPAGSGPSAHPSGPGVAAAAVPRPRPVADPEIPQLKASIDAKERAIDDLENFRRRRLSELNASLAEKSAMYTPSHPVIVDLQQTISSLSTESPQVQSLRADVKTMQARLEEKTAAFTSAEASAAGPRPALAAGGGGTNTSTLGAPPPLPGSIIRIEQESSDEKDPGMVYARGQLRDAMDKYSQLRTQIETAQIDLDTAEAAFKYRYSVIDPPLYPKHPSKPNALVIVIAGIIGGLFVAMFAALATDILAGRFVERWQVERSLDLPVLVDIDVTTLPKHLLE